MQDGILPLRPLGSSKVTLLFSFFSTVFLATLNLLLTDLLGAGDAITSFDTEFSAPSRSKTETSEFTSPKRSNTDTLGFALSKQSVVGS